MGAFSNGKIEISKNIPEETCKQAGSRYQSSCYALKMANVQRTCGKCFQSLQEYGQKAGVTAEQGECSTNCITNNKNPVTDMGST